MDRLGRILWPRGQARRGALIVSAVVVALAVAFALLNVSLSGAGRFKDIAAIVQSSVTAVAIVAGGIFAYYKLQLFRDLEPHLTITHEVSHRFVGGSYVHIAVTANLYNSSRVKIELREGFFRLQQVSPVSDDEVERIYAQAFIDEEYEDIQWPILSQVPRTWNEMALIVEPGGSLQETQEFIVSSDTESVIIYTYFYNTEFPQSSQIPEGWGAITVYDIIKPD